MAAEIPDQDKMPSGKAIPVYDSSRLYSHRVRRWGLPAISGLLPLEAVPGMISLVVGKPSPECFPFSGISIALKNGNKNITLSEAEVQDAFQYDLTPGGVPALREWFENFQVKTHGLATASCSVGSGSQDLIHKAFQVFSDPGDPVLIEAPAYSGVLGFLRADGHHMIEVLSDAEGLRPNELERILRDWPETRRRPRILYTVPTGSNPAGRSCTQERKTRILQIAKEYDILIFEDDAYYFLDYADPIDKARCYLSLEADVNGETGRVLRFDSLSKIVSAGIRLGVLTSSPAILQKVNMITGNTNLQAASTSQVIGLALLRHWGCEGFLQHASRVTEFYRHKRDVFDAAAERHLKPNHATWDVPTAGMFLWLKLLLPPGRDSFELLSKSSAAAGVLAVPGVAFMPSGGRSSHIRVSFSLISEEVTDEACRRIAALVETAFADEGHEQLVNRM